MIEILKVKVKKTFLYVCEAGESMESLCQKFKVSRQEILELNPLFSSVYAGCMLAIPSVSRRVVTVEPLDTLYSIAEREGVSVKKIKEINNLKSEKLFLGMRLVLEEEE